MIAIFKGRWFEIMQARRERGEEKALDGSRSHMPGLAVSLFAEAVTANPGCHRAIGLP